MVHQSTLGTYNMISITPMTKIDIAVPNYNNRYTLELLTEYRPNINRRPLTI